MVHGAIRSIRKVQDCPAVHVVQGAIDRNVPRKPALQSGSRGQCERSFLSGKPRPVGGELHTLWMEAGSRESEFRIPHCEIRNWKSR
jgi:hypothetical protein